MSISKEDWYAAHASSHSVPVVQLSRTQLRFDLQAFAGDRLAFDRKTSKFERHISGVFKVTIGLDHVIVESDAPVKSLNSACAALRDAFEENLMFNLERFNGPDDSILEAILSLPEAPED